MLDTLSPRDVRLPANAVGTRILCGLMHTLSSTMEDMQEEMARTGNAATNFAYQVGRRARDLYTVWELARQLAGLRASAADHPSLVEAARKVVTDVDAAWTALAQLLQGTPELMQLFLVFYGLAVLTGVQIAQDTMRPLQDRARGHANT